jgi:hypothetical protein
MPLDKVRASSGRGILYIAEQFFARVHTVDPDLTRFRCVVTSHPDYLEPGFAAGVLDGNDFSHADTVNTGQAGAAQRIGVHSPGLLHKRLAIAVHAPDFYVKVNVVP